MSYSLFVFFFCLKQTGYKNHTRISNTEDYSSLWPQCSRTRESLNNCCHWTKGEHCIGIAMVMGSNPVQSWMFLSLSLHNCWSCVHKCDCHSCFHIFICSSNLRSLAYSVSPTLAQNSYNFHTFSHLHGSLELTKKCVVSFLSMTALTSMSLQTNSRQSFLRLIKVQLVFL